MHGMRTTFRTHNLRREVLEFSLSHRVGDQAELSYWTSEMLDRRREVLEAWANFVAPHIKVDATPPIKRPSLRVVA